jgi:hypothetical protein
MTRTVSLWIRPRGQAMKLIEVIKAFAVAVPWGRSLVARGDGRHEEPLPPESACGQCVGLTVGH